MTPEPFLQVKSRVNRLHGQAISCSRCVDNDYKKGGIMIIITQIVLLERSASDQLEGTTEKRYIKKILNAKLLHAVVLEADKRCSASGKALQAKFAASEIKRVKKIHSWKTLQYRTNAFTRDSLWQCVCYRLTISRLQIQYVYEAYRDFCSYIL